MEPQISPSEHDSLKGIQQSYILSEEVLKNSNFFDLEQLHQSDPEAFQLAQKSISQFLCSLASENLVLCDSTISQESSTSTTNDNVQQIWEKLIEQKHKRTALQRLTADLDAQIALLESSVRQADQRISELISLRDCNMQRIHVLEAEIKAQRIAQVDQNDLGEIQEMMLQISTFNNRMRTQHAHQF